MGGTKRRPAAHRRAVVTGKHEEGQVCLVCGTSKNVHGHHIWEYAAGGPGSDANIVVLCDSCHRRAHRGDITILRMIF